MNKFTALTLTLFFSWCFPADSIAAETGGAKEKIIILDEGNWQTDNGRLSYFEDGNIVSNKWFRDNNGYKLGDTPNDIIQISDNLLAIAINWSNIIQFITPEGKAVAATEDVPNNRRLATDGKYVYVSSYGHECGTVSGTKYFTKGYVAKIDVATFKVVDAVEVGYEPEGIAYYQGFLFVANTGGYAFQEDHAYETTVSVINATTMKVEKTIDTGVINLYGTMSQSGQYLCINSPGDYYDVDACSVIFDCQRALDGRSDCFCRLPYAATYNTVTRDGMFYAVGSRYSYYTGEYAFNYATIDPAEVMRTEGVVGITEALPGTVLADLKKMTSPYDIYVNPYTGYIYATDAASFAEGGTLYQWNADGQLQGTWKVYINPAHLLALPPDGQHFTGISDITVAANDVTSSATAAHYNLSGQRIAPTAKGLHVVKGKKVIVK